MIESCNDFIKELHCPVKRCEKSARSLMSKKSGLVLHNNEAIIEGKLIKRTECGKFWRNVTNLCEIDEVEKAMEHENIDVRTDRYQLKIRNNYGYNSELSMRCVGAATNRKKIMQDVVGVHTKFVSNANVIVKPIESGNYMREVAVGETVDVFRLYWKPVKISTVTYNTISCQVDQFYNLRDEVIKRKDTIVQKSIMKDEKKSLCNKITQFLKLKREEILLTPVTTEDIRYM